MIPHPIDLDLLSEQAQATGKGIMEIYATDFTVDIKSDDSPLIQEDTRSHEIISPDFKKSTPPFPFCPKRGKPISFDDRKNLSLFSSLFKKESSSHTLHNNVSRFLLIYDDTLDGSDISQKDYWDLLAAFKGNNINNGRNHHGPSHCLD